MTARRMQKEMGGKIIFFYHDSDADYRETITLFRDPQNGEDVRLNFTQANKIQKKYSPLYAKMIPSGWQDEIARKLPRLVPARLVEVFKSASAASAGDFCLDMYRRLGLLDGIEVVRSGDTAFRAQADDLTSDYYADIPYEGEIVRAEKSGDVFRLHEGGGNYITIPSPAHIEQSQKNPGRDYRFRWMQSVVHCTHYISGAGENAYLKKDDFPDVTFVTRDEISDSNYAYLPEE